ETMERPSASSATSADNTSHDDGPTYGADGYGPPEDPTVGDRRQTVGTYGAADGRSSAADAILGRSSASQVNGETTLAESVYDADGADGQFPPLSDHTIREDF